MKVDILDYILLKQENVILKFKTIQKELIDVEQVYKEENKYLLDLDEKLHLLYSEINNRGV